GVVVLDDIGLQRLDFREVLVVVFIGIGATMLAGFQNLADIYELGKAPQGKYGPAYTIGRVGIVYDSAKVNPPITAWGDLWRDDLKSSVSLPGIT
ncbi:ABC transporter substrate-binding protein, partial [Rhizobium leguminosarum]|uniref:ABC transporter substrate-binding protein n=1 Tax=Rhizobium leguminosarum TaxID=384 RepID=UPI003F9A5D0F